MPRRPLGVLPAGEHAVLVELADLDAVLALAAAARERVSAGAGAWAVVEDVVPGARTLLLSGERVAPADLRSAVLDLARTPAATGPAPSSATSSAKTAEVRVRYDGPDLGEVARLTGLSRGEVVAAHTGTPWRVAFGGFAPGFAYLVGGDPRLRVPRRDAPRGSVPAGAVGLAGEFSGVYPRPSPGGWQLIGSTDAVLWQPDREPPALLQPGSAVRFVAEDPA
ncbi:allophanate hydrolase subunit 1 [Phycicoccus sp.]|uniref:5-oxoprolinase subunit B family protein n=1 Tax=Phycicoccus sp. TaxID=1902410 RepID=UPI002BC75420|nr:allophanate hydrolase subunit 1 [Phycicoccus sp.]HMM95780.1 allophanate hydrolase subunit 1 [Phycicoccus sp.]